MTVKQRASLRLSFIKYGMIVPIITNRDLLIADGEQKLEVAKGLGMKQVRVIRLPVDDVDRRLLRQVLNKLKGRHQAVEDAEEFRRILDADRGEDLRALINVSERQVQKTLEKVRTETPPESDIAVETIREKAECPQCGHQFNPENFMVETILEELEEGDLSALIIAGESTLKGKANKVVLNLSFETVPPEISDRVVAVAESFGVGIDETLKWAVFNKFELHYNDQDLIYVTGDSGSGKTSFLRMLAQHEKSRERQVSYFEREHPALEGVVIDELGGDADEAMNLLSAAGLSEAFLMLRRFSELSDGQKYRYRIAKMLSAKSDVYVIDELGTGLDRVMAKVLAYNLQKWARRQGAMILVASTHHDIIEDLNPDILIFKGFGETAQIRYYKPRSRPISLMREIQVEKASMDDYEALEQFHYLGRRPGFVNALFKLTYRGKTIGVVLYQSPFLGCSARNKAMPRYTKSNTKEGADRVNRDITRLSRIIIHPKFRGAGLAVHLVKETMPMTGKRVVETIAAMARYNPFFEKAGMTKVGEMKLQSHQVKFINTVKKLGGDPSLLHSPVEREKFLKTLSKKQRTSLQNVLMLSLKALRGQGGRRPENLGAGGRGADRMVRELAENGLQSLIGNLIPVKRTYLYWENQELAKVASVKEGPS